VFLLLVFTYRDITNLSYLPPKNWRYTYSMTEQIKADLAQYLSQFLSGKHRIGKAVKIINMIWDIAYEQGRDSCKCSYCDTIEP
jgi:hypothetical protein